MIFPVRKGNRWGLMNADACFLVPPEFDRLGESASGLASFELEHRIGFLRSSGIEAISRRFDPATNRMPVFVEGLAAVTEAGLSGFINPRGKWVIRPEWGRCWDFASGKAIVESANGYFVINGAGDVVGAIPAADIPFLYSWPKNWSLVRCLFEVRGNLLAGFVDWKGQITFAPRFPWMTDFSKGVALFCDCADDTSDPWGLVSLSGTVIKSPRFYGISCFSDGLARAGQTATKVGFINPEGEWMIEPIYRQACPFSEGLACVTVRGKKGFINTTGEMVIEPRFDHDAKFYGGVAEVEYDDCRAYIDKTGREIWKTAER